jgi:hypothetical protein
MLPVAIKLSMNDSNGTQLARRPVISWLLDGRRYDYDKPSLPYWDVVPLPGELGKCASCVASHCGQGEVESRRGSVSL